MTEKKKIKVEFAPGCFDHFDGTQDELDALVAEINRMAEAGEFEANSQELDEDYFDSLDPEEQAIILEALSNNDSDKRSIQ